MQPKQMDSCNAAFSLSERNGDNNILTVQLNTLLSITQHQQVLHTISDKYI